MELNKKAKSIYEDYLERKAKREEALENISESASKNDIELININSRVKPGDPMLDRSGTETKFTVVSASKDQLVTAIVGGSNTVLTVYNKNSVSNVLLHGKERSVLKSIL